MYEHVEALLHQKKEFYLLMVLDTLRTDGGQITRRDLLRKIHPSAARQADLSNSREDRKLRAAIARLRLYGVCIISSPGKAGYRLAGENDQAEVRKFVAQMVNAAKARLTVANRVKRGYASKDNGSLFDTELAVVTRRVQGLAEMLDEA